ncbi:MAG TPA: PEGA domain-containing protein [Kofleriaceae bacterium]|nr:PEGA domain-containing protein [Kofleriaceae bacterium]
MRALVAFLAVMTIGTVAIADSDVGVVVAGEPALQKGVQADIQAWLSEHGHAAATRPLDADGIKTFLNCFVVEDMTCARGTFERRTRLESLVLARVELVGGDRRELTLTGYWFVRDHDAVAEKRWCKRCDDAALARTVDDLMTTLERDSGLGKARIEIHSKPEGMVVVLDDAPIGVTPTSRDVSPGTHRIQLRRGDTPVGAKTITVEAGATAQVAIPVAKPEPHVATAQPEPERGSSRAKLWGGGLAAAGLVAIASAAVCFVYGHKGGPDAPLVYPHATRDGIVLSVAGAGAVTAGVVVWTRHF